VRTGGVDRSGKNMELETRIYPIRLLSRQTLVLDGPTRIAMRMNKDLQLSGTGGNHHAALRTQNPDDVTASEALCPCEGNR
jgi:hypothetical protein